MHKYKNIFELHCRKAIVVVLMLLTTWTNAQAYDNNPMTAFVPQPGFATNSHSLIMQLRFVDQTTIGFLSSVYKATPARTHIGDPPLLEVIMLDDKGELIDGFNHWHPFRVRQRDEVGQESMSIIEKQASDFVLPYHPDLSKVVVSDIELNQVVVEIDAKPIYQSLCQSGELTDDAACSRFSCLSDVGGCNIDMCPDDTNKTEPGICGCGITEIDSDLDGVLDCIDRCPTDPLKTEPGLSGCGVMYIDTDNDGLADNIDTDDDNDGVDDNADAFPLNPNETLDSDNDGVGDNADTDDDNDGVSDQFDAFPFDPAESVDTDNDGLGNNADTDDDNDGVFDQDDAFPLDPTRSVATPEVVNTSKSGGGGGSVSLLSLCLFGLIGFARRKA